MNVICSVFGHFWKECPEESQEYLISIPEVSGMRQKIEIDVAFKCKICKSIYKVPRKGYHLGNNGQMVEEDSV